MHKAGVHRRTPALVPCGVVIRSLAASAEGSHMARAGVQFRCFVSAPSVGTNGLAMIAL